MIQLGHTMTRGDKVKERFSDLLKKNGFYVLAAVCVIALAAAIGLISTNTGENPNEPVKNAAGFTDADTDVDLDNTNESSQDIAANSGLDYTGEYNADEIQNIITQIEESKNAGENQTENISPDADTPVNTGVEMKLFDDTCALAWPVSGDILMDFSMTTTTYFKTLDQYKCNPALLIGADVNTDVYSAYGGTVVSIENDAEIGPHLIIDMGNDYQTIYGQLKDITVSVGDTIATGTKLGTIAEPTKYYNEEGSHLYFELTKDDIPVDPKPYLESSETK